MMGVLLVLIQPVLTTVRTLFHARLTWCRVGSSGPGTIGGQKLYVAKHPRSTHRNCQVSNARRTHGRALWAVSPSPPGSPSRPASHTHSQTTPSPIALQPAGTKRPDRGMRATQQSKMCCRGRRAPSLPSCRTSVPDTAPAQQRAYGWTDRVNRE